MADPECYETENQKEKAELQNAHIDEFINNPRYIVCDAKTDTST